MKRFVYFIQQTVKNHEGNFIPCIATEGESGYHKTDYHWGKDLKLAEECAERKNKSMGIDKTEAIKIVLGTMKTSKLDDGRWDE